MSGNIQVFSIQRTYIINRVLTPEREIFTCNQRIDIPTVEPLLMMKDGVEQTTIIVPCIELSGDFLAGFDLTFETNEGVTVLPIKIDHSQNPYISFRYVLVLPRGTTGVKSCKLIHKATGEEFQHNFTFGIMPPPYNYENALFEPIFSQVEINRNNISLMLYEINSLMLTTKTPTFVVKDLPKGAGKQTINIEEGVLFYNTSFSYPISPNSTTHSPKITLHGAGRDQVYTLSLNKKTNTVSIDLFTGMLTVYAGVKGEIIQQFKLDLPYNGFETLSFENFDDIDNSVLYVSAKGARVK